MKKVILNMLAIAILCFGLSSGPAMAETVINLVGANAGSLGASVGNSTWGGNGAKRTEPPGVRPRRPLRAEPGQTMKPIAR